MPNRLRDESKAQLRRTEEAEACAVAAAAKALVRVWSHADLWTPKLALEGSLAP